MNVTPKQAGAPTFRVLVSFGSHTFTREWIDTEPAHFRFVDGTDERCFCMTRHKHSRELPRIVRAGATGKAYFSQQRNFMLVENLPGLTGPYAVFFNAERSRLRPIDVAVFIVSAYEKPNLPPLRSLPRIGFATLIAKTARDEPIRRP